jgi:hypothetical protein
MVATNLLIDSAAAWAAALSLRGILAMVFNTLQRKWFRYA